MEDAPARPYYQLFKYAHDLRAAYRSVAGLRNWPPPPLVHSPLVQRALKHAIQDTDVMKRVMSQIRKKTRELDDKLHNVRCFCFSFVLLSAKLTVPPQIELDLSSTPSGSPDFNTISSTSNNSQYSQ